MKLSNLAATQKLAASIVPMLRVGDCLTLSGDVGAGKTTFARQILAIMAPELKDVPSPTYALMQIYETSQGQVWHYDLYRLNSETELAELAWEEMADHIALIEWPEKAGGLLPKNRLHFTFVLDQNGERFVMISPYGAWQSRIKSFAAV